MRRRAKSDSGRRSGTLLAESTTQARGAAEHRGDSYDRCRPARRSRPWSATLGSDQNHAHKEEAMENRKQWESLVKRHFDFLSNFGFRLDYVDEKVAGDERRLSLRRARCGGDAKRGVRSGGTNAPAPSRREASRSGGLAERASSPWPLRRALFRQPRSLSWRDYRQGSRSETLFRTNVAHRARLTTRTLLAVRGWRVFQPEDLVASG